MTKYRQEKETGQSAAIHIRLLKYDRRKTRRLIRFFFHPCRLPRTGRSIPLRRTHQLTLCDRYGQTFSEANRRSRCDAADHGQGCGGLSGVREETGESRQDGVRVESVRHKLYITRWLDSQSAGCDAAARHLRGKQLLSVHGQCPTATVFLAQRVPSRSQHGDGWTVRALSQDNTNGYFRTQNVIELH